MKTVCTHVRAQLGPFVPHGRAYCKLATHRDRKALRLLCVYTQQFFVMSAHRDTVTCHCYVHTLVCVSLGCVSGVCLCGPFLLGAPIETLLLVTS